MQEIKEKLQQILRASDWSGEDRQWLFEYIEANDTSILQKLLQEEFALNIKNGDKLNDENAKRLLEIIHTKIRKNNPGRIIQFTVFKRVAAAVAILTFGLAGYYLIASNKKEKQNVAETTVPPVSNDIIPGGNKAVLTLGDKSVIVLDGAQNGTIANEGNTSVQKMEDGKLVYNQSNEKSNIVFYNTISTPRGGEYQLTLTDGTKVWLNAASSLTFPTSFPGKERKVEISGEAYFEVAKNERQPFKVVITGKQELEVLGTHFNINAYVDEPSINTTLLEGKVKVFPIIGLTVQQQRAQPLTPGQQSQLGKDGKIRLNNNPDIEEVMAWKSGKFYFGESADVASIMRQISRWYNVDVEIKGEIKEHIGGTMSRDVNVSKVFEKLEITGVIRFELEGRKVIVRPGIK